MIKQAEVNHEKFNAAWQHYEPRIRKTASAWVIPGAVGTEIEDLVQIGQEVLLHTFQKFNPSKGRFSTIFYTRLHNKYNDIMRRQYPRNGFIIYWLDVATGEKGMKKCSSIDLEEEVNALCLQGKQYLARPCLPNCRYQPIDGMISVDAPMRGGNNKEEDDVHFGDTIVDTNEYESKESIEERVSKCLPNEQLRNLAVALYNGEVVSGHNGVMRRMGLNEYRFNRAVQRIRMLLAGEFDVHLGG